MMNAAARALMYAVLGAVCLLVACAVFWMGATFGAVLGAAAFACVRALDPSVQPRQWSALFLAGGAMLGGGCGLILIARLWLSQALQSDDPIIRAHARDLDELRRAMRPARR